MFKKFFIAGLALLVVCVLTAAGYFAYQQLKPEPIAYQEAIFSSGVTPTPFNLSVLTLAPDGYVYGAKGTQLYRISDQGRKTTPVAGFDDRINEIHFMANGYWLVATDNDHWDPEQPCRIYLSTDHGQSFTLIKQLDQPSAIWWSIASDSSNNIYVGEYGPKEIGVSERVWKSSDFGVSWSVVFRTTHRQRGHIHLVAVDPYTDHVIVSYGDGDEPGRRGVVLSTDQGQSWRSIHDQKPTGIAFTESKIYFGEDDSDGRVRVYDKAGDRIEALLVAGDQGNYGGSIYDLAIGIEEQLFAPLLKYPKRQYPGSLWVGQRGQWRPLLIFASPVGGASGSTTIAGPDRDNFLYISGYRIENRNYFSENVPAKDW